MIRKGGPIFLITLCSLLMGPVWDAFLWRLVCRVVSFSIVFRERARSFSWVGRLGGSSVLVIGGVWFGRGAQQRHAPHGLPRAAPGRFRNRFRSGLANQARNMSKILSRRIPKDPPRASQETPNSTKRGPEVIRIYRGSLGGYVGLFWSRLGLKFGLGGPPGAILGRLGVSWATFGRLGAALGPPGGGSEGVPRGFWGRLGWSWPPRGRPGGVLWGSRGASQRGLGGVLGALGKVLIFKPGFGSQNSPSGPRFERPRTGKHEHFV